MTGTRTFVFTAEETRLIMQWAGSAWHDADQRRMLSRPGSPQELSAEADQAIIEKIQGKLTARESVTPSPYS